MNNEDRISNEQCTMNNVQWKKVKLGECCESELGKTLDEGRNTGLYRPYLCALNVLWGKIDLSTIKKMRIEDSELERYLVKKGDLLVCEGGEIGRCAIWEYDDVIYYQNALHRVRFYEGYDARFFMYLLCHYNDLKLIEQYGKGLTIKHLNQTAFRNIPVSIPSLPVQRRIAAILSSADKVIASTQKVIDKLKQIKQGMMETLLNEQCIMNNVQWRKVKLGEVGKISMCKRVFSFETSTEGEIPFYKIGTFGKVADAFISKQLYEEYKNKFSYPKVGDILISASGTIGRTVVYNGEPSYFQDSNIIWIDNDETIVLNQFLYYLYKTISWNLEGSTIARLYNDNFNKIDISIPDLAEQRRIAQILQGIDKKIETEINLLEKYKQIKKGLMEELLNNKK